MQKYNRKSAWNIATIIILCVAHRFHPFWPSTFTKVLQKKKPYKKSLAEDQNILFSGDTNSEASELTHSRKKWAGVIFC